MCVKVKASRRVRQGSLCRPQYWVSSQASLFAITICLCNMDSFKIGTLCLLERFEACAVLPPIDSSVSQIMVNDRKNSNATCYRQT